MSPASDPRNLTVLVATPEDRAYVLADRLRAHGLRAIALPTVRIEPPEDVAPLDRALRPANPYDWVIFTSARAVDAVRARSQTLDVDLRRIAGRVAAVGPATARALEALGLVVDFIPTRYLTNAIPAGLGPLQGVRIFLPRSSQARRSLADAFRQAGATVTEVAAYRIVPSALPATFDPDAIDVVALTSASSAQFLASRVGTDVSRVLGERAVAVCIGPVTEAAARELGFSYCVVAREHTENGLVDVILQEAKVHG